MRPLPPRYRLARALGHGSLFEVAVVSGQAGTELILKRPAQHLAGLRDGARALARERELLDAARGCALLPRIVEAAADDHGPYIVQTKVPGAPLRELGLRGPLLADDWLEVARSACLALASLQDVGDERGLLEIVHGDLSPDNLLAAEDHRVSLVDFATGTFRDARAPVFPHGRGTLPYVAPEIARAERPADQAADVYALAALLLWLAIGPIVDAANEAGRLREVGSRGVRVDRVDERPDLPASVRNTVRGALAFDRADRLTDVRALAAGLEQR